jgi:tRNA 5-methylaminomethyl-2-thiouridine biosynthesis bifunctional protein
LERLLDQGLALDATALLGRTAWRCSAYDRLPVIGAVPDASALHRATRLDQPRLVPRLPGLFVFTALGSRGITWSALGAQVLASTITGAPVPLEASLFDAIDPARFISRRARRAASG